jgi:hypothetical protein
MATIASRGSTRRCHCRSFEGIIRMLTTSRLARPLIAICTATLFTLASTGTADILTEDFQPACVRMSDLDKSFTNPEFSPDRNFMSWGENFTPRMGFSDFRIDYYITPMDLTTGDMVEPDGKGFLATSHVPWGAFGYWGLDQAGVAVYTIDADNEIYRIRATPPAQFERTRLSGPVSHLREYLYPSQIASEPTTYLVYLRRLRTRDRGDFFSIVWMDANNADSENYVLTPGGQPYLFSTDVFSNPRWVPDERIFLYPLVDANGTTQIGAFYVDALRNRQLTFDQGDKIDAFPFRSPEYPGEWLILAAVDFESIGIYRNNPGTNRFERIKDIVIPSDFRYVQSMETFNYQGKTFMSLAVNEDKPPRVLDPAASRRAEMWIADIDPASNFTRRVDDWRVRWGIDPETLVTQAGVVFYAYQRPPGSAYHVLYRCRTGLGN